MKVFELYVWRPSTNFFDNLQNGPLSFIFIFTIPMIEFEPWISGVRSNHSTNWATTTALYINNLITHFHVVTKNHFKA